MAFIENKELRKDLIKIRIILKNPKLTPEEKNMKVYDLMNKWV